MHLQGQALKARVPPSRVLKNYNDQIELLTFCLMPNHFHFLIKQSTDRGIAEFMQSLVLKYVLYFNKKYKRVGGLFQGRYKTVLIDSEDQFVYISKYIHRNPIDILPTRPGLEGLGEYKYSSYGNYLGLFNQSWLKTKEILGYFSKMRFRNTYQTFVEETGDITKVYYEMIDMDD
ncbi:hypothetical protein D4S03_07695 [bacterium]|nr:MAG: hypothetical protein D4S03_07695 [bacterium]